MFTGQIIQYYSRNCLKMYIKTHFKSVQIQSFIFCIIVTINENFNIDILANIIFLFYHFDQQPRV